jgi:leucyl-tRNA synthetase
VKLDTPEDAVIDAAMKDSAIGRYLDGKQIRKKIYVKNRILNLVVGD